MESTSVMHMNFLLRYISQIKNSKNVSNVVAIADGGPDWSVKGVINLMTFGYLWQNLAIDTLVIQCFAPGHSRFNPIERSWAYLTQCLVGVELSAEIDSETKKVPSPDDDEGWQFVLDRAVEDCGRFWNGKKLDSFPINIYPFFSQDVAESGIKDLHSYLKSFVNAGVRELKNGEFKKPINDYQFFVHHCNRKPYQLEFIRCQSDNCRHCSKLPTREINFLQTIRKFG